MKHISTQNLLVKKVYGETNRRENEVLAAAMQEDWSLKEDYEVFREVAKNLDSTVFKPAKSSISIILKHSRKTAPLVASC